MSRITRAALATAAGFAALAGVATPAQAAPATPSVAQLQPSHSGQCLTIADGALRNGANAVQTKCADGLDNQLFDLVPAGAGTFEVRAKHSGRCLEVENSGTKAGTNVQQWWCVGDAPQQRWKLLLVDPAKELYELRPSHVDDRCLDIAGGSTKEGANAQQWGCNGTPAQRWRVKPVAA
ncbi:RICIN domain-containing protein [Streptomyces sp. UNOB3_S3]|uniref:RICIN domain-containing protein n=1 Tax=Streptomyces sp. UNOB3_S3 TaxID=2871682 RepID=UPI001E3779D1|nr:RICIN domain-containing protein [Streptomyces sp. UNOB3_S3]MCC3775207.1 RICIN domain-containing protein [Streptomyces sp. UNOB3_S3]